MKKTEMTDKKRTLIFINIVISCIAGSMLATALTTAMPQISKDLQISVTMGQWLTSGYSLAMAITMPLTAYLINRFPTKKLYCSAVAVFLLGLFISGGSTSFSVMMVGRVTQAAGSGMLTAMAQVIVLTIFPAEKRGTAMGWYGLSISAAPIISPTLAGMMVDTMGWRMIFFSAFAIMLVSFIYALIVFSDFLPVEKKRFDVLSFVLSGFAFGGITLGIGNIGNYDIASPQVLAVFAVGLAAGVLFVVRQLRLEEPFLELRVLKNKDYAVSVLGSMLLYFVMMGSTIILPLYVQQTLGLSATISGLVVLPGSLLSALISPFAGKLYDKLGMRLLFIVGSVLLIAGHGLMWFVESGTTVWAAAGLNCLRNIAIACLMMPLVTWGAGGMPKEMMAHATALLTSLRTISGAIGSAVFVALLTGVTESAVVSHGEDASMYAVRVTFLAMAVGSVLLLALALWGTKSSRKQTAD